MLLEIDYREKKLIDLCKSFQETEGIVCSIKECNLELGDMIIKDDNEQILLLFERKTPADLASSIQDGRYQEQSYRLSHSDIHNHNIVYLIEGSIEKYNERFSRIKKSALYSALFTLQYYKGFSVTHTKDMVDTTYYLLRVLKKLQREKEKIGYYHGNKEFENKNYECIVKSEKKKNITKDNISTILLSQIPGVSHTIASCFMKETPTFFDFLTKCKEEPSYLEGFVLQGKDGKTRKISKKVIENIINYLF